MLGSKRRKPSLRLWYVFFIPLCIFGCFKDVQGNLTSRESVRAYPAEGIVDPLGEEGEDDAYAGIQDEDCMEIEQDPFESFNRTMFAFNLLLDDYCLHPISSLYEHVTPAFAQEGVSNMLAEFALLGSTLNWLLQAEPEKALQTFAGFLINGLFGCLGFSDVTGIASNEDLKTDFGKTLQRWEGGTCQSAYLVLPFLGPTNGRDIWDFPVRWVTDPVTWAIQSISNGNTRALTDFGYQGLAKIDWRIKNKDFIRHFREESVDLYSVVRNVYCKKRKNMEFQGPKHDKESRS